MLVGIYSHMGIDPVKETPTGREPELVQAWCQAFEKECRGRGLRVTPQRLAVYRILAEETTHPTADAVHARLRPRMPSLSLATVYRVLESFAEQGLIRRVSTTGGVGRFDANLVPHQHLVCRTCGQMSDHQAEHLTGIGLQTLSTPGFLPERLDIRVVGLCRACADAENSQ